MPSNEFTSFPIDAIIVDRDARQRSTLEGIQELAWSIQTLGLLHPVIIERNGKLRTGERRLEACRSLGWTDITVQFVDELSEHEFQLMELDENLRRVDLSWQDQCKAVQRYHELRSIEASWTKDKTAIALNISPGLVTQYLNVAKEIESGNVMVADAPKFSTARGITDRVVARRKESQLEALAPELSTKKVAPIITADFREWSKTYDGPKFNFLHCDFPYGVNADKHDQGAAASFGGYADGPKNYEDLLATLADFVGNHVSDSAHLLFWFSMDYYQYTLDWLHDMGWTVNPFPLIWFKSDNTGILPDPMRGPRRVYETCFLAARGDRKIVRAVSNVVAAPVVKRVHMSEKNLDMLRKFMGMLVDENTIGIDPTCGSGNAVRAMLDCGASFATGLEVNEEFANLAREKFYE